MFQRRIAEIKTISPNLLREDETPGQNYDSNIDHVFSCSRCPLELQMSVDPADHTFTLMGPQWGSNAQQRTSAVWEAAARRIKFNSEDSAAISAEFATVVVLTAIPTPEEMKKNAHLAWDARVVLTLQNATADDDADAAAGPSFNTAAPVGHRLTLHTADIKHFKGIYKGAVIGVTGTILTRSLETQRVESLAIDQIFHPNIPCAMPLPGNDSSSRVFFMNGPYGNEMNATRNIFLSAIHAAHKRSAHTIVACGPFIQSVKTGYNVDARTVNFEHQFSDLVLSMQRELALKSLHVPFTTPDGSTSSAPITLVLVPSLDDALSIPVLPQLPLDSQHDPVEEHPHVLLASNPCRLKFSTVTIGVCAHDSLSMLNKVVLERGCPAESRTRRLVESSIRSGLFTPPVIGEQNGIDLNNAERLLLHTGNCGDVPHIYFQPTKCTSLPVVLNIGDNGPLFLSSGDTAEASRILEVSIKNVGKCAEWGATTRGTTSVRVISL